MLQASSSLSRCFSLDHLMMSPFLMCDPSPDGLNLCPTFITDIIINEINVDLPGMDGMEFIEFYDGGQGDVSLNYTTLVLYNGVNNGGRSYLALGLDGYQTNSDGFFVIGSHLMGKSKIYIYICVCVCLWMCHFCRSVTTYLLLIIDIYALLIRLFDAFETTRIGGGSNWFLKKIQFTK